MDIWSEKLATVSTAPSCCQESRAELPGRSSPPFQGFQIAARSWSGRPGSSCRGQSQRWGLGCGPTGLVSTAGCSEVSDPGELQEAVVKKRSLVLVLTFEWKNVSTRGHRPWSLSELLIPSISKHCALTVMQQVLIITIRRVNNSWTGQLMLRWKRVENVHNIWRVVSSNPAPSQAVCMLVKC